MVLLAAMRLAEIVTAAVLVLLAAARLAGPAAEEELALLLLGGLALVLLVAAESMLGPSEMLQMVLCWGGWTKVDNQRIGIG